MTEGEPHAIGKVTERIRLTSVFDKTEFREVEAVVDTGAALLVLPQDIVEDVALKKVREVQVKHGDNSVNTNAVYGAVGLELKGRVGIFEALVEPPGSQPLIGQVVLESLDLVVDLTTRSVKPNPLSPETPMVEVL